MVFDVLLWGRAVTLHSLIGILMIVGPSIWLMIRRAPEAAGEAA
jgi:hypothetical protein